MNVSERMTKSPVTVGPKQTLSKAYKLIRETGFTNLPVVDGDNRLVGIITEDLIERVTPNGTSSLSDYEINHLLSKTKIEDIMLAGVLSVKENTYIENAALLMKEQRLHSLPVVDDERNLVGIITRTDIFKAFIDIMGVKYPGTRLTVAAPNKVGTIAEITRAIADEGADILNISNSNSAGIEQIVIKLSALNVDNIVKKIEALGYTVRDVAVQR